MRHRRRAATAVAALTLVMATTSFATTGFANADPNVAGTVDDDQRPRSRFSNPISASFGDTFADPMIVRGQDGLWYAYGTSDPLREGEHAAHRIPTARSTDLVNWSYVGDAFGPDQRPPYATSGAMYWAPDVRYIDGRYVMYLTVTDTTGSDDGFDTAVGAATAPTPTGPWTFEPEPVVAPRPGGGGGYQWTIDPSHLTDVDGRQYLYYGSYYGGIHVTELTADGLHTTGTSNMVAVDNKFEGSYVVRHDGYYYLFASSANCCAGPATGYAVFVGRSTSPRGPFVDRDGIRLDIGRAGSTPVVTQNGNRWIGAGHNGFLTDLSGQDWLVYHAIDRADPYLDEPFGINERPMLIDRLDWIDGWPTVRAGAGPSDGPQPAPVTSGLLNDRFDRPGLAGWAQRHGRWVVDGSAATGRLHGSGTLTSRDTVAGDARIEVDLRLADATAAGVTLGGPDAVTVTVDAATGTLIAETGTAGPRAAGRLPASFNAASWHNLAIQVRGRELTAQLSPDRTGGQLATVSLHLPEPVRGPITLVARGGSGADFDNVSAARLYQPVAGQVAMPAAGAPLPAYSDEFNGSAPGSGWLWKRQNPAATVSGGSLNWPVEGTDLVGGANTAGVLLRAAPQGDYLVETKVTLDLGEETVRNYQQAGMVAYVSDDHFARLSQVAIWNTRQVEYGYETPFAGSTVYGGNIVGTPSTTTWLRLVHHIDPANGEHEFRAASSRDGTHWTWGGVWTFPAGSTPQIGLIAQGGADPALTASFDYVHFFQG